MKRIAGILLWTVLFLLVLLGIDQAFLRLPAPSPPLAAVRTFYLDFRGRLLGLAGFGSAPTLEALIERDAAPPPQRPARDEAGPRYLWVDGEGALQFADSLEEVPRAYRKGAKPLGR